ncbi:MAG: Ig-like domain-containing protein [Dehalococcoidia bacterium]
MWERWNEAMRSAGAALRRRWVALGRRGQIAAGAGASAVLIAGVTVGLVLALRDGSDHCDAPLCVEVLAPEGEEVPPMTPVRIRLAGEGLDREGAVRALQISNEPAGQTRFEGDVLTFRPEWPGFAKGVGYDVALLLPLEAVPQGADPVDVRYRFTTAGKLEVSSVFPQDGAAEIALDGAVMVQFNRSVASLTVIADQGPEAVVAFDPPVAGEGRWLNTSLYTFRPETGWAPSTAYTATVKSGLANKLGSQLEADHVFRFSTLSPAVAQIVPADNSLYVSPAPEITVTFNQPVDRASAEGAFRLAPAGGAGSAAGSFAWTDDQTLTFRPASRLALASRYVAVVAAGVKARNAAATTAAAAQSSFETVGVPRVVSTTPINGEPQAQRYGINVTFSNPMDEKSVEDAFQLFPEQDFPPYFSWDVSGLRVDIGVSFDASTPYRFTLSSTAKDRYGQVLTTPLDVSFVTQPREPGFHIFRSGMTGTFNAYLEPTIIATSWNVDQLDFELYRIDAGALIDFERGEQQLNPAEGAPIRSWSETITNPPLDAAVTTSTRLAAPGERLAQGVYLLRMSAPGFLSPSDAMPFVVSSANVTTKWTDDDLLVWAVDMQSGAPLRGVPFEVFN